MYYSCPAYRVAFGNNACDVFHLGVHGGGDIGGGICDTTVLDAQTSAVDGFARGPIYERGGEVEHLPRPTVATAELASSGKNHKCRVVSRPANTVTLSVQLSRTTNPAASAARAVEPLSTIRSLSTRSSSPNSQTGARAASATMSPTHQANPATPRPLRARHMGCVSSKRSARSFHASKTRMSVASLNVSFAWPSKNGSYVAVR